MLGWPYKSIFLLLLVVLGCSGEQHENKLLVHAHHNGNSRKVVLVGIDGTGWPLLRFAIENGKMPSLKGMLERGVSGPLKSVEPALGPATWTSIATGQTPRVHGVAKVVEEDPKQENLRPLSSCSNRSRTLWSILCEFGRTVSIVRWPLTWPTREVLGEVVSDYAFQTNRRNRTYPDDLTALVDSRDRHFRLRDIQILTEIDEFRYQQMDQESRSKLLMLAAEYSLDVQYKNISRTLFERKQRDLTSVHFNSLNALHRIFTSDDQTLPDFKNLVLNWCWLYDQFLAEILGLIDPESYVFVCSSHGFDPVWKLPGDDSISRMESLDTTEKSPPESLVRIELPYDSDPFTIRFQASIKEINTSNKQDGFFLLTGPDIKKGMQIDEVHATEIAPTVLYLMGYPSALDFDRGPREDFFVEPRTLKPNTVATYQRDHEIKELPDGVDYAEEDTWLLNRLEMLGYQD